MFSSKFPQGWNKEWIMTNYVMHGILKVKNSPVVLEEAFFVHKTHRNFLRSEIYLFPEASFKKTMFGNQYP